MPFKNYIWDEQFDLNVSRNKVRGASQVHIFGATPIQSINTTATVWDKPDTLYPWSSFDTPGVLTVGIVNSLDNGKVIRVEGLDSNWNPVFEDFLLSSSATKTGTVNFKRVLKAYLYLSAQEINVGEINFTKGEVNVLRINAGIGQSLMGIYTVPAGYTGYIYHGVASSQSGADATGLMYVRTNYSGTANLRVGHTFEINGNHLYNYKFSFPQPIPEKSDLDVRLITRSNNGRFTASFDILLVDETL